MIPALLLAAQLPVDGTPPRAFTWAPDGSAYLYSLEIAMAGQLAGADWIDQQPYADPARLGITGWSYGGYLTAFTTTHAPGVFRSGIAGAPPADWRFYESAYTERYMGMPSRQCAAYREASVLPAAGKIAGTLLILQGTSDDNVHLMNSLSWAAQDHCTGAISTPG